MRSRSALLPRTRPILSLWPWLVLALVLVAAGTPALAFDAGPAQLLPGPGPDVVHPFPCHVTCPPIPPAIGGVPSHLTALGDVLFYVVGDDATGAEPWVSDGTFEGTHLLVDLCDGACSSDPDPIAVLPAAGEEGLRVVFWATTEEDGREPWVSDGTAAGTLQLADLCAGPCDAVRRPTLFFDDLAEEPGVVLDGEVLFGARVGGAGQLFASDGTPGGTRLVEEVCPAGVSCGAPGSFEMSGAGGEAYFVALRSQIRQLWRTDGSAGGTALVENPCPPAFFLSTSEVTTFADGAALIGTCREQNGSGTPELWVHEGAGAPVALGVDEVRDLAVLGGHLYALRGSPVDEEVPRELWVSDGEPASTSKALDLDHFVEGLDVAVGRLFLNAWDGDAPVLLATDGGSQPVRVTEAPADFRTPLRQVQGRALWWERPVREDPEIYEWWLVSWDPAAGRKVEQVFGSPVVGPDLVTRIADVLPTYRQVGGQLFLRAQAGGGNQLWVMDAAEIVPTCFDVEDALCLRDGRFQVEVHWINQHDGGGEGDAVPDAASRALAGDTGYFWFFRPDNLELAVKVLDGRGVNGHFWVFSGGTTNLEYELVVTDRDAGAVRRYHHAPGDLCAVVDTAAFAAPGGGAAAATLAATPAFGTVDAQPVVSALSPPPDPHCDPFANLVCVGPQDRFSLRVEFTNQHAGNATGVAQPMDATDDTALFRFFPNAGVETMVKVLDGRPVNGYWWVLWGGLTNLGYTVEVTDRDSEESRLYTNPTGSQCGGADTTAFAESP